jgi:hypothetical protein
MKKLEDELSELDPPYKTMQELEIGRTLDLYGIPFFYKQPTVVLNPNTEKNEIWKPSFTLPQYGCSVIDYIKNNSEIDQIRDIYRYNQIPAAVLGSEDLEKPNFQQDLYQKIQKELVNIRTEYMCLNR